MAIQKSHESGFRPLKKANTEENLPRVPNNLSEQLANQQIVTDKNPKLAYWGRLSTSGPFF